MDAIGRAIELWRYPASSFGGERRTALDMSEAGAEGDRLFGLVEAATGEPARPEEARAFGAGPVVRVVRKRGGSTASGGLFGGLFGS